MTDETSAPAGGEGDSAPIVSNDLGAGAPAELTPNQAAKALADLRWKRNNEPSADGADLATADPELSGEDNAAPAEQAHGEDQGADPAAEPPIARPKSWTEAEDAEWQSTPRALQQKIVARELERDNALRRTQNEAAEKLKGLTAKEQQTEQARQSYEARQAAYTQALETALQADFGDIRSLDDVRNLQANDPFRFQAWQVRQMELSAAQAEKQQVESAKQSAAQTELDTYKNEQDKLFHEFAPELADPKKKADVVDKAVKALVDDLGFKRSELDEFVANPTAAKLLFHHAFQKLVYNHLKLSDLKAAPKAVAKSDLPPVVRPGTSKPSGADQSEQVKDLTRKLNETGDIRFAQQLRALQARSRAS
jgi:hypothetical protein